MTQLTVAEILADARKQIENHKREVHAAAVKFGGPLIAWKDMPFVRNPATNRERAWVAIPSYGYWEACRHGRNMALAFLSIAPDEGLGRQGTMVNKIDSIIHDQCRVAGNSFNTINSNHIAIFEFWKTLARFAEAAANQHGVDEWRKTQDERQRQIEGQIAKDQKEIEAETRAAKSEAAKRGARTKRARKAVRHG